MYSIGCCAATDPEALRCPTAAGILPTESPQANVKAQHSQPLERPFVPPREPSTGTALSATPSACAGLPLLCTIDAQVALLCRDILRTSANGSVTGQSKYAQDGCCEFFSRLGRLGFTIV
jgi:hypothetical protein